MMIGSNPVVGAVATDEWRRFSLFHGSSTHTTALVMVIPASGIIIASSGRCIRRGEKRLKEKSSDNSSDCTW